MSIAEIIKELYDTYGSNTYGEDVTQIEHARQCAMQALNDGAPDFVVVASFLHDIGHLIISDDSFPNNLGNQSHETLGAQYLKRLGMPDTICELVAMHVYTKRYLVTKNPLYYDRLSSASKTTLNYQGGPLTEAECKIFEGDPLFMWHLKLRAYDDGGKNPCVMDDHVYWELINRVMK
jgi:predicted HD phosphohydrolase